MPELPGQVVAQHGLHLRGGLGQLREQPLGLGLEHLLQHDVLVHGPVRVHQRLLEQRGEVGRAVHRPASSRKNWPTAQVIDSPISCSLPSGKWR